MNNLQQSPFKTALFVAKRILTIRAIAMKTTTSKKIHISARIGEYAIPPLKDMLVMGKQAPIGCIAMRRAIELLIKAPFEHIELEDDIISDVLVRQGLLNRVSKDELIEFVITQVKPLMGIDEVLHAELSVELFLSAGN